MGIMAQIFQKLDCVKSEINLNINAPCVPFLKGNLLTGAPLQKLLVKV